MLTEQPLLLSRRKCAAVRAAMLSLNIIAKGASQLARAALQHGGESIVLISVRDGWRLRHQVEVQKLDQLEFDFA